MAPFFTILSFFFALCQGITITISQKIGAKRWGEVRRYAETSFFFMTVIALAIGAFWVLLGRQVLELMGARDRILDMGSDYVRIMALQFLSIGFGATAASIFQALGKTVPIMISVVVKCCLNILLNWLLIFGNWGFPQLGIAGSALGTAISSVLLDGILVLLLFRGKSAAQLRLRLTGILRPRLRLFSLVLKLGVPVGAEYILWSLGQAVIIALVNRQDSVSSGWFGVLNILIMLSIQVYNGIGVATLVLIGQATGAKRHHEVRQIANYGMIFAQFTCLVVGALFCLIPDALLSLFIRDSGTRAMLIPQMYLSAVIMFCKALNILAGNSIRGTGNTIWMLGTQVGGTIVIVDVAAILLFGPGLGITALMLAVLVDELSRGIVNEIKFLRSQRHHHPAAADASAVPALADRSESI
jgi:putative MATE family efflux protein